MKQIILGGGCFWCLEAIFSQVKHVRDAIPGYTGGNTAFPNYDSVRTGGTGHAEVVRITYNESAIGLSEVLDIFFYVHDPTTLNRQGHDIGTQYRSVAYYADEREKIAILDKIKTLNASSQYNAPVVTEVSPLPTFYRAEAVHLNYYQNNLRQPYCTAVIEPKLKKFFARFS